MASGIGSVRPSMGELTIGSVSQYHLQTACKRTNLFVPAYTSLPWTGKLLRAVRGSVLSPFYIWRAYRRGLPGIRFCNDSARVGCKALWRGGVDLPTIYRMIFWPVESTRYFEFHAAWSFLKDSKWKTCLDVSSPRLFPIVMLRRRLVSGALLLNPDKHDLACTAGLLRAAGWESRCQLRCCTVEELDSPPGTFDVITSLSVLEHIPECTQALLKMWDLLKPGGRLVLSVPCAAVGEAQYINVNHFGLQKPDADGYFFHQYVFDRDLMEERIFRVLGQPNAMEVHGEKQPGILQRGLLEKWSGATYPRWKEPCLMAERFRRFESLDELPGEGVAIMAFDKS